MFRELVIAFMGGGKTESSADAYCKACKAAKKDHCDNCDRKIEVIKDAGKQSPTHY